MKKIILIVMILVVPASFLAHHYRSYWLKPAPVAINLTESGGRYLRDLLATIHNADTIAVTEHSNREDHIILHHTEEGYREKTYRVKRLSAKEREDLIDIVSSLESKTQDVATACIFEPHHRIAFYSKDKLLSTMEICFVCGELHWDGTSQTQPWSLFRGMEKFIVLLGFDPKADWFAKYEPKAATAGAGSK